MHVLNPDKGYIVTANNRVSSDNINFNNGNQIKGTNRADRITEMLEDYIKKGVKLTPEICMKM